MAIRFTDLTEIVRPGRAGRSDLAKLLDAYERSIRVHEAAIARHREEIDWLKAAHHAACYGEESGR